MKFTCLGQHPKIRSLFHYPLLVPFALKNGREGLKLAGIKDRFQEMEHQFPFGAFRPGNQDYRKSSIKPPLSNKPPPLFGGGKLISPPSLLSPLSPSLPPPPPPQSLFFTKN